MAFYSLHRYRHRSFCFLTGIPGLFLLLTLLPDPVFAQSNAKTITAVRSSGEIRIDGTLDEPVWSAARPISDFTQREPVQDAAPTESTLVRVVFDDEAVYFWFTLFDSEPDKIVRRLARRDRPWDGDRVAVDIDPYHDHRTGYYFTVNAAGVEGDGLLFNDTRRDSDLDGVWSSSVKITDFGWVAEIKIPYHNLRFSPQETYTW